MNRTTYDALCNIIERIKTEEDYQHPQIGTPDGEQLADYVAIVEAWMDAQVLTSND